MVTILDLLSYISARDVPDGMSYVLCDVLDSTVEIGFVIKFQLPV